MQKNVVIEQRKLVQDLGTGKSYINLFVKEEPVYDDELGVSIQIVAGQQLTLDHPVTRDRVIDLAVRANYPDGASEAAIRKGIVNKNDPDFIAFNNFVDNIKAQIDEEFQ